MPEITVKNLKNKKVKSLQLDEAVFGYPLRKHLIYEAVHHQMAARRSGSASTRNRVQLRGGGRKPWRQKGTGRSRHGSTRSPLWRGGGTVFGPKPRSYDYAFPRKARRNALKSALSQKVREGQLMVLDSLSMDSHKTKALRSTLEEGLSLAAKTLLVYDGENRNLHLAARNNPRLTAVRSPAVSVVDVLNHEVVVFTEAALEEVREVLSR